MLDAVYDTLHGKARLECLTDPHWGWDADELLQKFMDALKIIQQFVSTDWDEAEETEAMAVRKGFQTAMDCLGGVNDDAHAQALKTFMEKLKTGERWKLLGETTLQYVTPPVQIFLDAFQVLAGKETWCSADVDNANAPTMATWMLNEEVIADATTAARKANDENL